MSRDGLSWQMKRGQVTMFIIVGALILIMVAVYVLTMQIAQDRQDGGYSGIEAALDARPIQSSVETCIEETAMEGILLIGAQGGYYILPEKSYHDENTDTAYYLYGSQNLMPSLETIQEQLDRYIEEHLPDCTQNIFSYDEGIDIVSGNVDSHSYIGSDEVNVRISYPLEVLGLNSRLALDSFSADVDVRLGLMHSALAEYMQDQQSQPDMICTSCLVGLAERHSLFFDIEKMGLGDVIISAIDFNDTSDEEPFYLIIANKHQIADCSNPPAEIDLAFYERCMKEQVEKSGYSLSVEDIPDMEIEVGQELEYNVRAFGSEMVYLDYTDLFDIDARTGKFSFMAEEQDVGNHTIWIEAQDQFGNRKTQAFRIGIIENGN